MTEDVKLLPLVPTEVMWGGLGRQIMLAFDLGCKTPRALLKHLNCIEHDVPQWLLDEPEMKHLDHAISKGTRCVLIYRAMAEAAENTRAPSPEVAKLREALERLKRNFDLLLAGKSVRDVAETEAEVNAALADTQP